MSDEPERTLSVHDVGAGEPILFVHGTGGEGQVSWEAQRPLADRYRLRLVDRRGYGDSPDRPPSYGFAEEAAEVAALLEPGTHLVGQSYGGVIALLVAALRPELVRSLTVSEPPALAVAQGDADADWVITAMTPLYAGAAQMTAEQYDTRFIGKIGEQTDYAALTPRQWRNLEAQRLEHAPWLAQIPLDALAAAPFPKLVISGDWGGATDSPGDRAGRAFTAICDALARQTGAERAVVSGAGHRVPRVGQPYNDRLATFLAAAP